MVIKKKFNKETSFMWETEFRWNSALIKSIQTLYTDQLRAGRLVLLNDIYDGLGMERTLEGCVYGWSPSESSSISLTMYNTKDGSIDILFSPYFILPDFKKEKETGSEVH